MPYVVEFAFILIGFVLLVVGADKLVESASSIAARFGMPERVIGLTIVAAGTSLPELVVSVTSGAGGHADMVFGNVVGSCLANILLILGISSLISPIPLARSTRRFEIPASIASVVLLLAFANTGGQITVVEGATMLAFFAAFMVRSAVVGTRAKRAEDMSDVEPLALAATPAADSTGALEQGPMAAVAPAAGSVAGFAQGSVAGLAQGSAAAPAAGSATGAAAVKLRQQNLLIDALVIAVSIALLKFGADFVVDNSVIVASGLGVSERVIGITVVALGTCLPELVTGVVAALKGNTEIAVGNVIGSNVANVLLVIGAPALFSAVSYDAAYNVDFILQIVFTAALLACAFHRPRNRVGRIDGIAFTFLYVAYIVASLLR